jgi:hypothetical protein
MNRSPLHLLPIALLTFSQVVGTAGVVRSEIGTHSHGQTAALDRLIQKVKTANQGRKAEAIYTVPSINSALQFVIAA